MRISRNVADKPGIGETCRSACPVQTENVGKSADLSRLSGCAGRVLLSRRSHAGMSAALLVADRVPEVDPDRPPTGATSVGRNNAARKRQGEQGKTEKKEKALLAPREQWAIHPRRRCKIWAKLIPGPAAANATQARTIHLEAAPRAGQTSPLLTATHPPAVAAERRPGGDRHRHCRCVRPQARTCAAWSMLPGRQPPAVHRAAPKSQQSRPARCAVPP